MEQFPRNVRLGGTEIGAEAFKDISLGSVPCDSLPLSPLERTSVKIRFSYNLCEFGMVLQERATLCEPCVRGDPHFLLVTHLAWVSFMGEDGVIQTLVSLSLWQERRVPHIQFCCFGNTPFHQMTLSRKHNRGEEVRCAWIFGMGKTFA